MIISEHEPDKFILLDDNAFDADSRKIDIYKLDFMDISLGEGRRLNFKNRMWGPQEYPQNWYFVDG